MGHESAAESVMGAAESSDESLMMRVCADDETAYRLLIERHIHRMHALAQRLLNNPAAAEDVIQEAFLQVWIKRSSWQESGARFSTWLHRVVINRCIDVKRKQPMLPLDDAGEVAHETPDAVSIIHKKQVNQRLHDAIDTLSGQQHVALTLFYFEGHSNAEAAEIMAISVSAFESLLKRARQKLRESLRHSAKDSLHALQDDF